MHLRVDPIVDPAQQVRGQAAPKARLALGQARYKLGAGRVGEQNVAGFGGGRHPR